MRPVPVPWRCRRGPARAAAAAGNGAGDKPWRMATRILHGPKSLEDPYAAVSPPLYQTATFDQPSATTFGPYDYTRSGNPTRQMLEEQVAAVDGATRGFAFASGMAALTAVTRLVRAGERVVAGNDIYGGTSRLLAQVLPKQGIKVTNVDMTDLAAVERACGSGDVKLVLVESPTNPMMRVCPLQALADVTHSHSSRALLSVDNTLMSPLLMRPLDHGADIVVFVAEHWGIRLWVSAAREQGSRWSFILLATQIDFIVLTGH